MKMQQAGRWAALTLIFGVLLGTSACTSIYKQKGELVQEWATLPSKGQEGASVDDVSYLLGAEPVTHKTVEIATLRLGAIFDEGEEPVPIVYVYRGGPADAAGIVPGMVIRGVNGVPVDSGEELGKTLTAAYRESPTVVLTLDKNGEVEVTAQKPVLDEYAWKIKGKHSRYLNVSARFYLGVLVHANYEGWDLWWR